MTIADHDSSDWYSQCVPGSGGEQPSEPQPITTTSNPAPTGGNGNGGGAAASGLNGKFKAKGKEYFGTEIDHYHLNNNALMNIVKSDFGQVTCENSMKWDAIEREFCPFPDISFKAQANLTSSSSPTRLLQLRQR